MNHTDFGHKEESGLHLMRLDMMAIYRRTIDPIHIDEFDITDPESVEDLKRMLFSTYEGDALNNIPKCACLKDPIISRFNLGVTCARCNTQVSASVDTDIDSRIWIRANERQYKFIVPRWMGLLDNKYSSKGVQFLRWFGDPRYRIAKDNPFILNKLVKLQEKLGIERGWRSMVDNLLPIIEGLNNAGLRKITNLTEAQALYDHVAEHIDIVFSECLPLPSNIALIKEKTSTGTYGDTSISDVINGARTISELYTLEDYMEPDKYDQSLFSAMMNIANGYTKYNKEELFRKQSLIRSAMISGRMDMSARAVITSITRPHDYREIEIPWAMGIKLFEKPLVKYLYRTKKMGVSEALMHLRYHYYIYDEVIDKGLQTILSKGPAIKGSDMDLTGFPCTLHRNPGLKLGSQQTLYITIVKTDPRDWTISLSSLILAAPNADFDGDNMNLWLIPDMKILEAAERFSPYYNLPDLNNPGFLSGSVAQEQEITMNIANYIDAGDVNYGHNPLG